MFRKRHAQPGSHSGPALLTLAAILSFSAVAVGQEPSVTTTQSDEWRQFRGPRAAGLSADAQLPVRWDLESGEGIAWRTPIPGLGHSSPIATGDSVFITTAITADEAPLKVGLYGDIKPVDDEGEVDWTLTRLDLDGEIVWTRSVHRGAPAIRRHPKASHASSTPATDGERVFVMLGSEGLHAFDLQGEKIWSQQFGVLDSGFFLAPTAQWGFASSPIVHEGSVYLQADVQGQSFIAAFDAASGEQLWRTERDEVPTWSTPTVIPSGNGQAQLVLNGYKHIGAYGLADGAEIWRMSGGGDIPTPTPIYWNELALITSAHGRERPIYAIDLNVAEGDLDQDAGAPAVVWEKERAGNYMQTPIVVGDIAYFCMDNGLLSAYSLPEGEQLYKLRLGKGKSGFTASPVATSEAIYFASEDGDVHVVRPGREFEELAVNSFDETIMATPAIVGDMLLIRSRSQLTALRVADAPTDDAP